MRPTGTSRCHGASGAADASWSIRTGTGTAGARHGQRARCLRASESLKASCRIAGSPRPAKQESRELDDARSGGEVLPPGVRRGTPHAAAVPDLPEQQRHLRVSVRGCRAEHLPERSRPAPVDGWGSQLASGTGTRWSSMTGLNDSSWFDRSGNFHLRSCTSSSVTRARRPTSSCEPATIEDPERLHASLEDVDAALSSARQGIQLMDFGKAEFVEELMPVSSGKKPALR